MKSPQSLRHLLMVLLLALPALAPNMAHAGASLPKPTVLITGASRGIGFELARQYAERGWGVIATCRNPKTAEDLRALDRKYKNLKIEQMDVTDHAEIERLAKAYEGVPIDVLINNAGILGGNDNQKFGAFVYEAFDKVMDVNVKGPLKVTEAFVDNVALSEHKKIMSVSSAVGSIKMTWGGQIFYRASKSALNMSMRSLAKEFRRDKAHPERKEIIFGLINPGVVDTDFAKGVPIPMISPAESAAGVIEMIDRYTQKESGDFFNYSGSELPW